MAVKKKQLFVDVYDPATGLKITSWLTANLNQFTKNINSGLSECILELPYNFDYAGADIAEGNEVKISISDNDTGGGVQRLIYWGYISMIEGMISDRQETMKVHLLGFQTMLALDIVRNSLDTTITFTAVDIGTIIRTIIDYFKIANPLSKLSYTALTIPTVGQVITYTLYRTFYQDALDRVRAVAPPNYYFYIDENNVVNFKAKPTTPTHTFVLGKHFTSVQAQRGVEKIRNSLLLWNGLIGGSQIYKRYEDAGSIALYGRRTKIVDDNGVGNIATANMLAANFLTENKDPEIVLTVEIIDNTENTDGKGYDIESIQPGDTCSFIGFSEAFASRYLSANMLITSVVYTLDKVTLTIDPRNLGIVDWQDQTAKNALQNKSDDTPVTYTT
jgi:hypothetical protein